MGWEFDFHIAEVFSLVLVWLDIIGPTARLIIDLFLALGVGALSLLLLISAVKESD